VLIHSLRTGCFVATIKPDDSQSASGNDGSMLP
jgi:hypothetical protein